MNEAAWWMLFAFYCLIVVRWLLGHVEINMAVRSGLLKPATHIDPKTLQVPVSVIIAAHDEEDTIARCLQRVLSQNYPARQIIVANDRSTDATGEIVRRIAEDHPNVQCIDIEELPDGWLGKTHALSVAARHATGEYLVFTDSDVDWHEATLTTIIDLAKRRNLDFVSLWPKVIVGSFWEGFMLPACGWVLSLWFRHIRQDRIESTPAFANGQFLTIRREAYEKLGGHAAVRDEMAEDVALAQRAKRLGMRRYLGLGRNLIQTRMYENLTQIVRGWTRIFIGALQARWKLVATIGAAFIGCFSPFVILVVLVILAADGKAFGTMEWAWLAAAVVHLIAMYSVSFRHFALTFEGSTYLPIFPLALVGVVILIIYCLPVISGVGSIRWGNVLYQVRGSRAIRSRQVTA